MNEYQCNVEARMACGTTRFYPLNESARGFAELVKCDTLTKIHIKRIKALGYEVNAYYIANGNAIACADGVLE